MRHKRLHIFSPNVKRIAVIIIAFLILVEAIIIIGAFFQRSLPKTLRSPSESLPIYASKIISQCEGAKYRPSCYDKAIPQLMERQKLSMDDAFTVVKLIQQKDRDYPYCHIAAHNIGEQEVKKNPSEWKNVLARCPTALCDSGCLHGTMMERFKKESLSRSEIEKIKPELKRICEKNSKWNPSGTEVVMCYHGVGHLLMYMTNANVEYAIDLCKYVSKDDTRVPRLDHACLRGVFMQVFQPLEPEGYALIKDIYQTKETYPSFCNSVDTISREACFLEAIWLKREDIKSYTDAKTFCDYAHNSDEQRVCHYSITGIVIVEMMRFQGGVQGIYDYCIGYPSDYEKSRCFASAAIRTVRIEPTYVSKALEICSLAKKNSLETACYTSLVAFATFGFHEDSLEFNNYCMSLPSPWDKECLQKKHKGSYL